MKKTYIYLLFGLMVIAQIAASAQIVYKYENTIASNNVYKFKTAPVDPNDPFRGKYVALNFAMDSFATDEKDWDYSEKAYAYVSKDENGYAVLETLSKTILPNSKFDYVAVDIRTYYGGIVHFDLPFDTYYMKESKAYDAELLYRNNNRRGKQQDVYAVVHIQGDTHVLTDVVINGMSMKDAVAK
ncbi:GDYXXLXY domain-containing protein [Kordia sp.]|uniref:GDYXXLXY domain-containing protein n=1 Tax=Kordia sp. TaxID=1965332 RepID=UPI003B59873F